jgi:isocitrate dehydrogenase
MNLYSCIRPVKYISGTPSPVKASELVDMIVFRENTEDVYAGFEWEAGSPVAKKLIEFVEKETNRIIIPDSGIGIKPISRTATRRLVIMAIKYAIDNNRKSVTLVHKGNIMKFTEGAFRNWGYETAEEFYKDKIVTEEELWKNFNGKIPDGKILIQDRIADAMFQQILLRPAE